MKNKYLLFLLFALISITSLGQNKEVQIGPGPLTDQPEPIFIYDGIKLTSKISKIVFSKENMIIIDSVSIQKDSIFDCNGQLINLGIIKIFTKDSVNIGAKKILELTDNWIYNNPMTELEINNKLVEWDDNIYNKLISLKPENILSVKIKRIKKDDCNSIINLKIKG
jgi:hypothetical protein